MCGKIRLLPARREKKTDIMQAEKQQSNQLYQIDVTDMENVMFLSLNMKIGCALKTY